MKILHWIAGFALAQAPKYPAWAVRMLVGFAPGGATDNIARFITPGLTEGLGQPVVVENRLRRGLWVVDCGSTASAGPVTI